MFHLNVLILMPGLLGKIAVGASGLRVTCGSGRDRIAVDCQALGEGVK